MRNRGGEILALDGLEGGLAAALPDHPLELFGADLAGYVVVGEDLDEGVLVLRLDEGLRFGAQKKIEWHDC
jgi:hypothetical protein